MNRPPTMAWLLGIALLGCRPAQAPVASPEPAKDQPAHAGLRLIVEGAPAGTTLTVEASDTRPPLIATRPLASEEQLDIPPGFVTVHLSSPEQSRRLQFSFRSGATLRYDWATPDARPVSEELIWLDADAVMRDAKADFDALMAVAQDPAELAATLAAQRETIEALGDDPATHLRRLHHAGNAIQITGPDDAWAVIEPIPPDSPAWAAYAGRLVELRALFGDHGSAAARFEAVRARVEDIGLLTAMRAGDLLAAERSGEPSQLAQAYVAASAMSGPPRVGEPMPRFELIELDSRAPIRSEALRGTPYLIELWSTWCAPCLDQMEALHQLHAELGEGEAPRLRIISVAVNDTREPITQLRQDRWPMPWTNAWAPDGAPIFAAWSIESVPYAVLVDAEGVVVEAGPELDLAAVRSRLARSLP